MRAPRLVLPVLAALAATFVVHPTAQAGDLCADPDTVERSVEQARLAQPEPQEILASSGFAERGTTLLRSICATTSPGVATALVRVAGAKVWHDATARAQGRKVVGDLPAGDDRPLYWARLDMSVAIDAWADVNEVTAGNRERIHEALDRGSRGQDSLVLGARKVRTVVVTGFDPFTLDRDVRIGNPSGANALALDGRTFDTPKGKVRIETATYPVLWDEFTEGEVEHTLHAAIAPGPRQAAAVVTVSQGFPEKFTLEMHNGAARGGFGDNENLSRTGTIPVPDDVPTVTPQPQWTRTTLPTRAVVDAVQQPFPVLENHTVVEIPAGGTEPVERPDGPTPGSTAVAGGGGDYLSNEITYRTTLLRDAYGQPHLPVGHLHTPVLVGLPTDGSVTSPEYDAARTAITTEARKAVLAAAAAIG